MGFFKDALEKVSSKKIDEDIEKALKDMRAKGLIDDDVDAEIKRTEFDLLQVGGKDETGTLSVPPARGGVVPRQDVRRDVQDVRRDVQTVQDALRRASRNAVQGTFPSVPVSSAQPTFKEYINQQILNPPSVTITVQDAIAALTSLPGLIEPPGIYPQEDPRRHIVTLRIDPELFAQGMTAKATGRKEDPEIRRDCVCDHMRMQHVGGAQFGGGGAPGECLVCDCSVFRHKDGIDFTQQPDAVFSKHAHKRSRVPKYIRDREAQEDREEAHGE